MTSLRIVPTADVDLAPVRALCDAAFGTAEFNDDHWDHALGGLHALVHDGDRLVAHAALVTRRLLHAGRSLRTGYVEAVAVSPDARRRGHGTAVMRALERHLDGYALGALAASDQGRTLYLGLGWTVWPGTTAVLAPTGIEPTPEEDGGILVRPATARLDPGSPLICDWREGDVW